MRFLLLFVIWKIGFHLSDLIFLTCKKKLRGRMDFSKSHLPMWEPQFGEAKLLA